MALLDARQVTKRFGGLVAVDKVDFVIENGMITSLIGPNGAGKTTFFNCITGFYRAEEGEIIFDGHSLIGLRPDTITKFGIARTFQNIRLFQNMTALENVMVGEHPRMKANVIGAILRDRGTMAEEKRVAKRAFELLDFVGLRGHEDEMAKNLAYGSQRRLEIARALATDPKLLLLRRHESGRNQHDGRVHPALARRAKADHSPDRASDESGHDDLRSRVGARFWRQNCRGQPSASTTERARARGLLGQRIRTGSRLTHQFLIS